MKGRGNFQGSDARVVVIEVEVHSSLLGFLRFAKSNSATLTQGIVTNWPHQLTMARLVARALRLGRSALIQTGVPTGDLRVSLSYLAPALMWTGPVILVTPLAVQQRLLQVEIPQLQKWLQTDKAIYQGIAMPPSDFQGLLLAEPESWLADRLEGQGRFPTGVPTIIDGADDLEQWARDALTACIQPGDWEELMLKCPENADAIRDARVQLTKAIFGHPPNPYECCSISESEQDILRQLYETLSELAGDDREKQLPASWRNFHSSWGSSAQLMWASIERQKGLFSLYCGPVDVAQALSKVWPQQPVVLIGGALDLEPEASVYRQQVGLDTLTCLKFSPDRHSSLIQLYVPDKLPLPNTPQFQYVLMQEVRTLLSACTGSNKLVVLLVGDVPLKAQVAAVMAAEFGSRVQVEKTLVDETNILVTGWEFWRQHQNVLPTPGLLIVGTLPIPTLENPLVAGRVAYYKKLRKDWFRLYLLPTALRKLQMAIAPVRECQGVVALLDSRVHHRSYGQQVLAALSPLARINYPDASWHWQNH